MKSQLFILLLSLQMFYFECNNSTQPSSSRTVGTVTMRTDSIQYVRSLNRAMVYFRITNKTDSTLFFPTCSGISIRIDLKQGNVWSEGNPEWNSPCQAMYRLVGSMEKDAIWSEFIYIDTTGTFRVVTIYGLTPGSYTDTLFSNEFTVL